MLNCDAPPPSWRIWVGVKPAFWSMRVRVYWFTAERVVKIGLPLESVTMLLLASRTGADPRIWVGVKPAFWSMRVRVYWFTAERVVKIGLPLESVTMLLLASRTGADP